MGLTDLKEKLRAFSPLGFLKKIKEAILVLSPKVISFPKDPFARFANDEVRKSHKVESKRLIVFILAGVAAVLIFSIIIIIVTSTTARPEGGELPAITAGFSIPSEELFFPSEPDFLPGFLPEREPRRFWSLEEIRQYWKTPGNPDWWREEIKSTVDNLMEGVP